MAKLNIMNFKLHECKSEFKAENFFMPTPSIYFSENNKDVKSRITDESLQKCAEISNQMMDYFLKHGKFPFEK